VHLTSAAGTNDDNDGQQQVLPPQTGLSTPLPSADTLPPTADDDPDDSSLPPGEPFIGDPATPKKSFTRHYTNKWALRIEGGTVEAAEHLAEKYGFVNLGPVIPGGEYYLFESRKERRRSNRKSRNLQSAYISREENVLWLEQQVAKKRVKRDFLHSSNHPRHHSTRHGVQKRSPPTTGWTDSPLQLSLPPLATSVSTRGVHENYYDPSQYADSGRTVGNNKVPGLTHPGHSRQPHRYHHDHSRGTSYSPIFHDLGTEEESDSSRGAIGSNRLGSGRVGKGEAWRRQQYYGIPNDPFWRDMWYLHRSNELEGEMDHNVKEAWDLGFTGRGVVVTILDDGLERTHPDISPNYDPLASYDVNDRDDDPTPRYEYTDENRHGTRCAGEVASVFNNSLCIVGIAFNAKIGGIRMLDG